MAAAQRAARLESLGKRKAMGGIDAVGCKTAASPRLPRFVDSGRRGQTWDRISSNINRAVQLATGCSAKAAHPHLGKSRGRRRHGVLDVRGVMPQLFSTGDLPPVQGGAGHADANDGDGMGRPTASRPFRLPGFRPYLDAEGDSQPASWRAPGQGWCPGTVARPAISGRAIAFLLNPSGELHHRPSLIVEGRAHAFDPQPCAGVACDPRGKAK